MQYNYLKKHIEALFTESTALNANLLVLDSLVSERSSQLKTMFPPPNYDLISMVSSYRDLSQLDGGDNLYDTGIHYKLHTDNLDEETLRLLSYVSCLTISQVFEVFESFLKNILAESICQNIELMQVFNLETADDQFNTVRKALKKIQGTSNKGFIKAIRKISPFFKFHESKNIWDRNMSDWFNLIATVRHIVIHQRQNAGDDFIDLVKNGVRKKLFNRHFSFKGRLLVLTPYQANAIIDHLYEYSHLIYKGISQDFGLTMDFDFRPIK